MSHFLFLVVATVMGLGYFAGKAIEQRHYGQAGLCITGAVLMLLGIIFTILGY